MVKSDLMTDHHSGLLPVVRLQHRLRETSGSVRTPDRLLRVVRLGHGLSLHLHGDHEVGAGVGVLPPSSSELDVSRHLKIRDETEERRGRREGRQEQNQERRLVIRVMGPSTHHTDRERERCPCPQPGDSRDWSDEDITGANLATLPGKYLG